MRLAAPDDHSANRDDAMGSKVASAVVGLGSMTLGPLVLGEELNLVGGGCCVCWTVWGNTITGMCVGLLGWDPSWGILPGRSMGRKITGVPVIVGELRPTCVCSWRPSTASGDCVGKTAGVCVLG